MSRTLILATAAVLFAGVSAFAADPSVSPGKTDSAVSNQTGNSTNLNVDKAAPDTKGSSGSSDATSAPAKHMHHHGMRHTASSDNSADKLNACMVSGTPTEEQERCLHHAENAS